MEKKPPILRDLFLSFAAVGCFTFGGGYAMLSVITDLCVDKKQWITRDEMLTVTAIAESTPGPIAINCATYVGYQKGGLAGATLATAGMVLPSFLVIFAISLFLDSFLTLFWVANAFRGIQIGVGILIMDAGVTMVKNMPKKLRPRLFAGCAFAATLLINALSLRFSSIALMLTAGVISLALFLCKGAPKPGGGGKG